MKTIVEALQDLYVALGGKKTDVSGLKLNPDVIEQIAALVNEGALNELPAVTIEDAGDVLTVDNSGKWGKAAPSGGGSSLPDVTAEDLGDVLTVVEDPEHGETSYIVPSQTVEVVNAPANVTFNRIFEDGEEVIVSVNGETYTATASGTDVAVVGGEIEYYFSYDLGANEYTFSAFEGGATLVPGEYTVSAGVNAPGAKWDKAAPGGEPLIINISETAGGFVMDKTYSQIKTAFLSSGAIGFQYDNTYGAVVYICDGDVEASIPISVSVYVWDADGPILQDYVANTVDGYPKYGGMT